MKTLMMIPLLLISLSSKVRATVAPFQSITIAPFYNKGTTKIAVVTKSNNLHFLVFIQNDLYMNRCIVSDTITKAGTYTYDYDNSSSRNKNTVYVRYYTDDPTASKDSQHFERNLAKSELIRLENDGQITSNNNLVIVKNDGSYTTRNLSYTFYGFNGLYVPAYYHKIDLDDFELLYDKLDARYLTCNPSLIINNYNHVFDDVEGANESVTFNLKLKSQKIGYTFELKDDLYVNRETLRLSSTPKEGYVKTRHIYLPVNEMQNQSNYDCNFVMTDFGIDKDMIVHNFKLKALKNTFGDCSNSKYCIIRKSAL